MKVRHRKGVAIHPDPESCGAGREAAAEALTGEAAGQPLSRENECLERRRCYALRKATPGTAPLRAVQGLHAVEDPEHAEKSFVQELGDLVSARRQATAGQVGEGMCHKPNCEPDEKSDACIVPTTNGPNNGSGSKLLPAEDREG